MKKFTLGSAQFGLDYGIANEDGKLPEFGVQNILSFSQKHGVTHFDTSEAYGNAEELLMKFIDARQKYRITTKFTGSSAGLQKSIFRSLSNFSTSECISLLFHSPNVLEEKKQLLEMVKSCDIPEKIKIGFSLYTIEELETLFKLKVPFKVLQIPYSLFDQRFTDYFEQLKSQGVEIQVRSVFLQGLPFKNDEFINYKFGELAQSIIKFKKYCTDKGLDPAELLLLFPFLNESIDSVVIGINNCEQLDKNIKSLLNVNKFKNEIFSIKEKFLIKSEKVLLPYNW
ncbi:MAG: aldo/keto reductase [Bdellovibrionales bacterium]|nr:aldo/keto reductase [Bdellovibrionales bacterium]